MSISVTNKLPFAEDEFDHVHVQSIATGVPENKVPDLRNNLLLNANHFVLVGHFIRSMPINSR